MPALSPEPCIWPGELLDSPELPSTAEERWWVLHTRPRAEKSLARKIHERASFFLPVQRLQRLKGGKRKVPTELPLFPGYVFLYGNDEARVTALQTNLIVNCLNVEDQARLQNDLHGVYSLMQSRLPLNTEQVLEPGDPVRIIRGPLTGMEGTVIRRGPRLSIYVEVNMLNRGVTAEIEAWMLTPIGESAQPGS